MRILLIGATGQIGYSLTHALSRTAHPTTVLVRTAPKPAFPDNIQVREAGEFSAHVFQNALQDMDCVIYGVGLPEQFSFDPQIFQRVNYELFQTFLEVLAQSTVRRLVYISTYEVFQPINGVIRESNPIANPQQQSPYFSAMTRAYQHVHAAAGEQNLTLTTIHPAAVYGGQNTGDGLTNLLENLLLRRVWQLPVIIPSRFPVVHASSLAAAIVQALDKTGPYIVSDQMTSLEEMALTLNIHAKSYIPPLVPPGLANFSGSILEFFARSLKVRPILSRVQIEFLTKGWEPKADRAQAELDWVPMSLSQGIQQYLRDRKKLLP